jgi:hypothetical protein
MRCGSWSGCWRLRSRDRRWCRCTGGPHACCFCGGVFGGLVGYCGGFGSGFGVCGVFEMLANFFCNRKIERTGVGLLIVNAQLG